MRGADRWATLGVCALLLALAGCAQRWSFGPPGQIPSKLAPVDATERVPPEDLRGGPRSVVAAPKPRTRSDAAQRVPPEDLRGGPRSVVAGPSPRNWQTTTRLPAVSPVVPGGAPCANDGANDDVEPAVALSLSDGYCRPEPAEVVSWGELPLARRLSAIRREAQGQICLDHRHAYSWPIARGLLWGIAGASLLANTSLDEDFQDWVQDDLRGRDTDRFSAVCKTLGDGEIFVPTYLGLALAGKLLSDVPAWDVVGEFGNRTSRAYLVGIPPMLVMQVGLGGSRPGERDDASYWRPFHDNKGVSGHAFVGAVPFITAARMSHSRPAKACWYFLSALPAWSRVNDDRHYLSQALVGWWMAYLACESIDRTDAEDGCFTLAPLVEPDMVGLTAVYRR